MNFFILQVLLVIVGAISSIICGYFVSISFYNQLLGNETTAHISDKVERISVPEVYEWKINPDNSYKRFDFLPSWGSFRPGYYFGMKSMDSGLATGIMWLDSTRQHVRHETRQGELQKLDWIEHDGTNYGTQELVDFGGNIHLETTFVLPAQKYSWIQKIASKQPPIQQNDFADFPLFFYIGSDCLDKDENCLSLSSFSDIRVLTSKDVPNHGENHLLFHCIGKNRKNKWVSFQIFTKEISNVESFSYYISERNVITGTKRVKELVEENRESNRKVKNNELWFDEFGELSNKIENANRPMKSIYCQIRNKKNVELFFAFQENLEENEVHSLLQESSDPAHQMFHNIERQFTSSQSLYSKKFQEKFQHFVQQKRPATGSENESMQIQIALSSLLGGIGYFEGQSRIEWNVDQDWETIYPSQDKNVSTPKSKHQSSKSNEFISTKLLTATPSRTIFPRGFLWDEGFHQFVISHWNANITMKIISDWLNAMYLTDYHYSEDGDETNRYKYTIGWIPREMILGEDSRQRVPDEFITQRLNIANPPTFLLVLEKLLNSLELNYDCQDGNSQSASCLNNDGLIPNDSQKRSILKFIKSIYPRLHYWVQWLRITQESHSSAETNSSASPVFRWRGRSIHDSKVIPNTLSSGLDDYPRSIFPTADERHVDLHCWVLKSYQIMNLIEKALLFDQEDLALIKEFSVIQKSLDIEHLYYGKQAKVLLNSLMENHYSKDLRGFYDYGLNNESAIFLPEVLFRCGNPETKTAIDGYIPIQYIQQRQQNPNLNFCPPAYPQPMYPMGDGSGGYVTRERLAAANYSLEFIPRIGYVNLFPFLLKVLPKDKEKQISEILEMISNPKLLYTNYGLRSMATTDKFYLKRNSAGDAPYWR
jgi:mannosyl-oligosaccharide glucosidase